MKEAFSLAPPRIPSFSPSSRPLEASTLIPHGAVPPPPLGSAPPSRRSRLPPEAVDVDALYASFSAPRPSTAPGARKSSAPTERATLPAASGSTHPRVRDTLAPPSTRLSQLPGKLKSIAPTALAIAAASFLPACATSASEPPPATMGTPLSISQLDVTEGSVHEAAPGTFDVSDAKMRAVSAVDAGDSLDLEFTYQGATDQAIALDSGEMRRQLGIKLRAQDGCNVIYVMWHIDPVPELLVQVKTNPGQSSYDECHDNGYHTVKPDYAVEMPKLDAGSRHVLSASIENGRLLVRADGRTVWEGELPASAREMHGTMGIRSDNAKFQFALVPGDAATPAAWAAAANAITSNAEAPRAKR